MLSPSDIEVLLHYHCCCEPHPRIEAGAVADAVRRFVAEKLIEPDESSGSGYKTTSRGVAHVNQLCALPLPTPAWQDINGVVIQDPFAFRPGELVRLTGTDVSLTRVRERS